MNGPRRTLYIPDDVWDMVEQAAIRASADRKERVSVSQYVREAIREKVEREYPGA